MTRNRKITPTRTTTETAESAGEREKKPTHEIFSPNDEHGCACFSCTLPAKSYAIAENCSLLASHKDTKNGLVQPHEHGEPLGDTIGGKLKPIKKHPIWRIPTDGDIIASAADAGDRSRRPFSQWHMAIVLPCAVVCTAKEMARKTDWNGVCNKCSCRLILFLNNVYICSCVLCCVALLFSLCSFQYFSGHCVFTRCAKLQRTAPLGKHRSEERSLTDIMSIFAPSRWWWWLWSLLSLRDDVHWTSWKLIEETERESNASENDI